MKKNNTNIAVFIFFFLSYCSVNAQKSKSINDSIPTVKDSTQIKAEHKLSYSVELFNRYIWRGQSWGGNYAVVQPTIEYELSANWTLGLWATTNFKKDNFYQDQETAYKGYHEIDFYVSRKINKWVSIELWDYYWPSVSKVDGVNNQFFNYGKTSVNTIATDIVFDFSDFDIPIEATWSTFLAGNDYRYDENGENPKQNYTTYFEVAYTLTAHHNIEIKPTIGAVFNNQAAYYTAADYDKPSVVTLGFEFSKNFKLKNAFEIPISLNYIHNGATKNTETFGRNFLLLGISLKRK